jgi:hypothetical protein
MSAYFFNRRLFFRRTINEPAWIERASNSILERCTLVNVCEVGARLTIGDVYDLPESFVLHLTRGSEPGRQCRVIWQRNHEVGVEFVANGRPQHDDWISKPEGGYTPPRSTIFGRLNRERIP